MLPLPETAVCLQCGYSLRSLPENVCPECGRGFEPADPGTWQDKAVLGWAGRLWYSLVAPPSRLHVFFAVLATIIFLVGLSTPSWVFDERQQLAADLALLGITPIAIIYAVKLVGRAMEVLLAECGVLLKKAQPRGSWRWLVLPNCLAIIAVTFLAPSWPFYARLWVSRPFLEFKATNVRSTGASDNRSQWVGLLCVERVGLLGDGRVKFQVRSGLALMHDPCGVGHVQSPDNGYTGYWKRAAKDLYWYSW